jgi:cyclic pyranopterin phosphate synthase
MPEKGVELTPKSHLLTTPEIVRISRIFIGIGVDKIRLTGGEPTIRKDINDVVEQIGNLPGLKSLAMTTNGIVLSKHLSHFKNNNLTQLNISLDTLRKERFTLFTRRLGYDMVLRSIDDALGMDYKNLKINCVVMNGKNDDEIIDFVRFTKDRDVNVRFIEYMPFDDNKWSSNKLVPYRQLVKDIETEFGPIIRKDDHFTEVAKNFSIPGFKGSVSFITSMTDSFCGGCNRTRIMADGNYKVCLFGNTEVSLRDHLRSGATDEEIINVISMAVKNKKKAHAGMDILHTLPNRPMIKIGG